MFSKSVPFIFPNYQDKLLTALMSGAVPFSGVKPIDLQDLSAVIGGSNGTEENWLSNFVVDEYLKLVSSSCKDSKVHAITWEKFENCSVERLCRELYKRMGLATQVTTGFSYVYSPKFSK